MRSSSNSSSSNVNRSSSMYTLSFRQLNNLLTMLQKFHHVTVSSSENIADTPFDNLHAYGRGESGKTDPILVFRLRKRLETSND